VSISPADASFHSPLGFRSESRPPTPCLDTTPQRHGWQVSNQKIPSLLRFRSGPALHGARFSNFPPAQDVIPPSIRPFAPRRLPFCFPPSTVVGKGNGRSHSAQICRRLDGTVLTLIHPPDRSGSCPCVTHILLRPVLNPNGLNPGTDRPPLSLIFLGNNSMASRAANTCPRMTRRHFHASAALFFVSHAPKR